MASQNHHQLPTFPNISDDMKRTIGAATVKNRPITYEPHLMPAPSQLPWASCHMPWTNTVSSTPLGVMQFGGEFSADGAKHVAKRKADNQLPSLPKRHITDETMAEHLNGLHISHDYTAHQQQQQATAGGSSISWEDAMSMEPEPSTSAAAAARHTNNTYITMSSQDLEQKLKNANSITICEQIRKMQNEPVLPQALLDRIERPCLAVVLWQAPLRVSSGPVAGPSRDCITEHNNNNNNNNNNNDDMDSRAEDDDRLLVVDDLLDNNNSCSSVDLNSSMDMDL